jgi:hypothetical protein
MFFGPSKKYLDQAKSAYFLTKNTCGDSFLSFHKILPDHLIFFFNGQQLRLDKWTDSAQACCLSWILMRLRSLHLKGEEEIAATLASSIKNHDAQINERVIDCYLYTSKQLSEFASGKNRHPDDLYAMLIISHGEWLRSSLSGSPKKSIAQFDGYEVDELEMFKVVIEYLITPYINYWK